MRRHITTLSAVCVSFGCSPKVPEPWASLGIPAQGLETVREDTNKDRFSADYKGLTAEALLTQVEGALVGKGYKQTCREFDGLVRGYVNGPEKLLAKVDLMGPVLALTVGNKRGADQLLYGICFEGHQLGEPETVK